MCNKRAKHRNEESKGQKSTKKDATTLLEGRS